MKLVVNGEDRDYDGEANLAALVTSMAADPERVATMLNDEILKKNERDAAPLSEGDRVEVLSFAGGG
ncbi:MAG: sulfur carrier protein ThiS [Kiritimatiellia bacterium]|jgi:thiamine biosynthesis protein ThiS|nr:sulfur carrier protein ThiS [Candidatus Brocadiia bacterium]MDP6630792.1 sulfur carrier protein ThiS [Kiritimatiellia bacterium]MDP6809344.1 sulfur carrier protein ThiS [Kiritimatiellia bacterium]MDP7023978.1 sulfur carrier protein ThiS [Kiritimatiellia bacterium]